MRPLVSFSNRYIGGWYFPEPVQKISTCRYKNISGYNAGKEIINKFKCKLISNELFCHEVYTAGNDELCSGALAARGVGW